MPYGHCCKYNKHFGNVRFMVGLNDLKGLFQLKLFYDNIELLVIEDQYLDLLQFPLHKAMV